MAWVAVAVGVGAVAGGYMSSRGAQSAANTQANASSQQQANILAAGQGASAQDLAAIGQTQSYLQPYANLGANASGLLNAGLQNGSLTAGFNPTMQQLESMPGYQFQRQQGLEAMQNGFAAKGLGSSGAAMKGAGQYAQGLASTDMNNLANIYYQNQNNAYQRLMGATGVGANAASNQAQINQNMTLGASNALMGGATNAASLGMAGAAATAAGQMGSANAIGQGISNGANAFAQYQMANNALTSGGGAGGSYFGNMYGAMTTPSLG